MSPTHYNSSEKLWSGDSWPPIYNIKNSLGTILLNSLSLSLDKIVEINAKADIKFTGRQIRDRTICAAQNLQKYNFEKGDVFAIVSRNNHQLAPIVFAGLCMGNPLNALDITFSETEIIHMFGITKPKAVFCELDVLKTVQRSLSKLNNSAIIFTFDGSTDETISVADLFISTGKEFFYRPEIVTDKNQIAFITCSSGTTGLPKAIGLTHESLLTQICHPVYLSDDTVLCFSSLYWLSGISQMFLTTISCALRVITTENYSPECFFDYIEKYRVTKIFASTYHITQAMKSVESSKKDFSSVKLIIMVGSKAPNDIVNLKKYFSNVHIAVAYGTTEVCGSVSVEAPFLGNDSVGSLSNDRIVKIVDNDGKRLGVNEIGEICIKRPNSFYGYYNDPKTTADIIDDEDFIHTGDIGNFDENGKLYFLDRKKDILKYCNYMISPTEIESFLISFSGIKSCCVVGVDDYVANDLPAVAIVKMENAKITEQEIYEKCANHFSDAKKFRGGIYFVDSLPITPSGKILRREVKRILSKLYEEKKAKI